MVNPIPFINDYKSNIMANTKICKRCGRELPLTEFYANKQTSDGKGSYCKECCKGFSKTPLGRAYSLIGGYRSQDRKYGRGECNLTAKWLVENIFTKPCVHCGTVGWDVIGCNRIDNSKAHTMDNVEPCCKKCNLKLAAKEAAAYQKQFNRFKLK